MRKQQAMKANYEMQLASLKEQIKTYKTEIDKLSKTAINYQQSSKNIAQGSEHEIKMLRDKVRVLQRMNQQAKRQGEYYQTNMRDKDDVINDLKGKIYNIDKENLQLNTTIKGLEHKIERIGREHRAQVEELEDALKDLKEDNKNLKMPSSRDMRQDPV